MSEGPLQVALLGPLRVSGGAAADSLRGPRLRRLLAALAVSAGEAVPDRTLVRLVWPTLRPAGPVAALHAAVGRLRRGIGDGGGAVLRTTDAGYRLDLGGDQVDAGRFRRLVADGERAVRDGDPARALGLLTRARELWSGDPLEDVLAPGECWPAVVELLELRRRADELRWELALARGTPDRTVPELRELVRRHPLDERLAAHLARALAGAGRGREAERVLSHGRAALADVLGIEPGPDLVRPAAPPRPAGGPGGLAAMLRVAEFAVRLGAHREAVLRWGDAARLAGPDDPARTGILLGLAEARWHVDGGGRPEAAEALTRAEAGSDAAATVRALAVTARLDLAAGDLGAAGRHARRALALLGAGDSTLLGAGDGNRARPTAVAAATCLAVLGALPGDLSTLLSAADRLVARTSPVHPPTGPAPAPGPAGLPPDPVLDPSRPAEVRPGADPAAGQPTAAARTARGLLRLAAGDPAGAVTDLDAARAAVPPWTWPSPVVLTGLAEARLCVGAPGAAAAAVTEALRSAELAGCDHRPARALRVELARLAGRWEPVAAEAASLGRTADLAGAAATLSAARVLLLAGDLAGAGDAVERALTVARRFAADRTLVPALATQALLRLCDGQVAPARASAAEALDRLRSRPLPGLGSELPLAAGRLDLPAPTLRALPRTPWAEAAVALLDGDPGAAAACYGRLGSAADVTMVRTFAG